MHGSKDSMYTHCVQGGGGGIYKPPTHHFCCQYNITSSNTNGLRLSIFVYLFNSNKIDFYDYLVQLKQKLQIEKIICIDEGNPSKFKQFEFILDDI